MHFRACNLLQRVSYRASIWVINRPGRVSSGRCPALKYCRHTYLSVATVHGRIFYACSLDLVVLNRVVLHANSSCRIYLWQPSWRVARVRIRVRDIRFDSHYERLWNFLISNLVRSGLVWASGLASYHPTRKDSPRDLSFWRVRRNR